MPHDTPPGPDATPRGPAPRWAAGLHAVVFEPRWRRRALTAAVGLSLTLLPLVGTLGYEHAFVLGPLASLGGIAVGVDALHHGRARDRATLRGVLEQGTRELAVLLAIAFAMPLVGQLWQRACEPLGGVGFFAMGPGLCALLGLVAGLWGGVLARRRRRALLLGALPMIACTGIGLWRLFAEPVVFAFDPFWGYFSGSVYDEAVAVTATYGWFRLYNLGVAAIALAALAAWLGPALRLRALPARATALRGVPLVLLAGAAAAVGLSGSRLGFTADLASIEEVLSQRRETEHFVILYAPRSADARSIDAIAIEHEFAWAQLREAMGGREPDGKVTSFVFANAEQKRRLMGAGTVQVAAPWRRQIYLDHRPFPHPVLHHELAHVFGATVGDAIFGVSREGLRINVGLIEGFATAMAPKEAERLDLHDQALVLRKLDKLPPMAAIMGPGFLTKSSQVAYTAAGSFCLWLVQTHGFEPMGVLYGSAGDFERAYGVGLAPLEAQWIAFLDGRGGVADEDVAAAAQRFKRRSVFERPCAHRTAELRGEIDRATARGRFDEAIEGWRELCRLEPDQTEHGLGLAQALALHRRWDEAQQTLVALAAGDDLTTTMQATIAERSGDVALVRGALDEATAAYARAMALPQSEQRLRLLQLRALAARQAALRELVLTYLSPFDPDDDELTRAVTTTWAAGELSRTPSGEALGHYLLGRGLLNAERPDAAERELARALRDDGRALPSADFVRAAHTARLEALVMLGRSDDARAELAALRREPAPPHGYVAQWDEWAARIAFFERYAP
ncbi:MAG: hypothetical protein U0168_11260 [Nannocystaceae bacterium]